MVPIEIEVPRVITVTEATPPLEIAVEDVTVRCAVGTDVAYVAALVRALRA